MTSLHPYWPAPQGQNINATVALPGSKSLTNRELLLSAIASEPTLLIAPLVSRDSSLMISALESLGIEFEWQGDDLLVTPKSLLGPATIDCGLAGTVMRFVPPLSMLATGEIAFDGDEGARRRPMHTTIDSIRALGIKVTAESDSRPFKVFGTGRVLGGELAIDASSSSQFVSGLLLVAAKFEQGLTLRHTGEELPSLPHIEMTLETLRQRGVDAKTIDERTWRVEPPYRPVTIAGGRGVPIRSTTSPSAMRMTPRCRRTAARPSSWIWTAMASRIPSSASTMGRWWRVRVTGVSECGFRSVPKCSLSK
jgi:3-phosphoshikimate 1-carboxyvinyltransferase